MPALDDDGAITNFTEANAITESFNLKVTGQTRKMALKCDVEIMEMLKICNNEGVCWFEIMEILWCWNSGELLKCL